VAEEGEGGKPWHNRDCTGHVAGRGRGRTCTGTHFLLQDVDGGIHFRSSYHSHTEVVVIHMQVQI
jgi:hypothetical protein